MQRITNQNYSDRVIHGAYYPHIDGIRALAVLPVVLFHILASLCPGGFAGVDVFFVISGYLITGGILRDLKNDRFTIRDFYHRRIRRIMPAYFSLIAGVFAIGCAIYYCIPLLRLGDAAVMGTLFSANLYFWKTGNNYFSPDIHQNPLLHLWSLSVEEQFYLFIPLLIAMLWKFRRQWLLSTLAAIATTSFACAVYAVATKNQNGAFYLLHFRAWELLSGSLLAIAPKKTNGISLFMASPTSPTLSQDTSSSSDMTNKWPAIFATTGLLMVVTPYVMLSETVPFPGATALSSVIGTVLLIRYGQSGWGYSLLSWRPFVITGKISYSLYLWHWPVTVFWKYAVYDQLYAWDYVGMFFLSLFMGYISWRFIEVPVRTSPAWTIQRSFLFTAAGVSFLLSIGICCIFSNGWPTILHPKANALVNINRRNESSIVFVINRGVLRLKTLLGHNLKQNKIDKNNSLGIQKDPEVLLVGDSHADAIKYGMDMWLKENGHSGQIICRGAKSLFYVDRPEFKEIILKMAQNPRITKVVLVQYWTHPSKYWDPEPQKYVMLGKFADIIKSMGGKLYIATDVPVRNYDPSTIAAKKEIISPSRLPIELIDGRQSEAEYNHQQGDNNRELERVCREHGAILIPLHLALKQDDYYIALDNKNNKTIVLYRDDNHLSVEGSIRVANFIAPYLFTKK